MNDYLASLERLAMPDEVFLETCLKNGISRYHDYELLKNVITEYTLIQSILEDGIWIKNEKQFYYLEPDKIIVSMMKGGFIIHELYFEDLDCVMDTTGLKLYSEDHKKLWFLKQEVTEGVTE